VRAGSRPSYPDYGMPIGSKDVVESVELASSFPSKSRALNRDRATARSALRRRELEDLDGVTTDVLGNCPEVPAVGLGSDERARRVARGRAFSELVVVVVAPAGQASAAEHGARVDAA
jgi:hypothetical protein